MNFKLGQPFRPYQQLMGVLPDRSKKIVPTPYHDLMTNPDSPIIDFYPRDFELDMNGKKMDWEAVVKIPFIQEDRLLKAMATKEHELSEDEYTRNEFGVSLKFTYNPDLDFTYPSSLVGIFPDLQHCRCVENIFDLPTMDGLDVHVGLMNGVKLGTSALAGFPSLQTIPHHGALDFHGVNVFQQDSRNESMVITILDSDSRTNVEYAKQQLGQKVFVGYPFLSEAKVVRVSDELFDYTLSSDPNAAPLAVPHGPNEIETWRRKSHRIRTNYSKRLGMDIGEVESLLHVETLKGLRKTDLGATVKDYGIVLGIETDFASQVIVDEVESEDQRFLEKAALSIEEEYPEGTRAFSLMDMGYGRPLEVTGHSENKADVWISLPKAREPDFATPIIRDAERLSPYSPSYAVAKMLDLNALVLSRITASFSVNLNDTRINLGLNLKFEAKKLKVLGYSRRGSNGWEFSEKAIQLIQQYMVKFPEFIAVLQQNPQGDVYNATDFYPEKEAPAKIKEIQSWLKSIESKHFEKVPLEAEQLDSEIIMKIQQAADASIKDGVDMKRVKNLPRNALLKPSDAEHRLGNQTFALGHRVVYVQDSGKVPIASRGTVVGLTRTARSTLLDVVFDVTFMSGSSLNDRCDAFRGSTVPTTSVLNISHRQLVVGSKATDARKPPPRYTQPVTANGYGMPFGPGGRGQLVPANAPPPLRGSFRSAVSGTPNGASGMARGRGNSNLVPNGQTCTLPIRTHQANPPRGRAGQANGQPRGQRGGFQHVNRQGYIPLERLDGAAPPDDAPRQTANFTPQSYRAVPPPANLDAPARGRGRGRGGRGFENRGR